jgi:hypothetical protein
MIDEFEGAQAEAAPSPSPPARYVPGRLTRIMKAALPPPALGSPEARLAELEAWRDELMAVFKRTALLHDTHLDAMRPKWARKAI